MSKTMSKTIKGAASLGADGDGFAVKLIRTDKTDTISDEHGIPKVTKVLEKELSFDLLGQMAHLIPEVSVLVVNGIRFRRD